MSIDTSAVGTIAAEMMDQIAERYGADAHIDTVAIIVEVDMPDTEGRPGWTAVDYRCSDTRRWVQLGFFEAAKRAVLEQGAPEDDGDDES